MKKKICSPEHLVPVSEGGAESGVRLPAPTPGIYSEWPAERDETWRHYICRTGEHDPVGGRHVLVAIAHGDTPEQAAANGKLLAAAPELADALEGFLQAFDNPGPSIHPIIAKARAALAKAGRAQMATDVLPVSSGASAQDCPKNKA